MHNIEPTLKMIENYNGNESVNKRKMVWIVILSVLLIGAIYSIISVNSSVSDEIKTQTNSMKYS